EKMPCQCPDPDKGELPSDIYVAALYGKVGKVEKWLKSPKANVNQANEVGRTLLHIASRNGHSTLVKTLVKKYKSHLNTQDNTGMTALMWAVDEDLIEVVQILTETETE
ncbi:unnamed protein product, partial [Meganyctiphanes norvegica]